VPEHPWRSIAQPYGASAPVYDVLSGEWPVYRPGRAAGINALRLRPGDTVLDVGCGTGLSFPLLSDAVGPTGHVIGVDASPQMLAVARRRAGRLSSRFTLLHTDATNAEAPDWQAVERERPDAVLFVYSLSVMQPWRHAYQNATARASDSARVCVVDMARPAGGATLLSPLARLACWLGGADIEARPWRAVEETCSDIEHQQLRAGHIRVVAGTRQDG
jgi:demethylmenaquinone methyltransferase/2-methoxy-6-polyprenyl-1,4-benzoquinol methylase